MIRTAKKNLNFIKNLYFSYKNLASIYILNAFINLTHHLFSFLKFIKVGNLKRKKILYVGHCYYYTWYLSRELRKIGWVADLYNFDQNKDNEIYYHGHDLSFNDDDKLNRNIIFFYIKSLIRYDVFHFSNKNGIQFGEPPNSKLIKYKTPLISLLKALGKKIIYTNNGCNDGVSKTSFDKWKNNDNESACDSCSWKNNSNVCSNEINIKWGNFRNKYSDYQCFSGGYRADCNLHKTIHETPQFFCLDEDVWNPNLKVPRSFKIKHTGKDQVNLFHVVGNYKDRTNNDGKNIKSTHLYLPLIKKLKKNGFNINLINPRNIPNINLRYYQVQSDIFIDMLTFGWFGATAREAMMLGKPVICNLRPEWVENVRKELPEYIEELPVVNANPANIEEILVDLIKNKNKRIKIGQKSRQFALKWHSSKKAAKFFDNLYMEILND